MEGQQNDSYSVENDREAQINALNLRIRIVTSVALLLIVCGIVLFLPMLLIGIMLLPVLFWLRSQRTELAKQSPASKQNSSEMAKQDSSPRKTSLARIVISRVALAALLSAVADPMMVLILGGMSGIALVMALIGKSIDNRVRFVKAAIYGAAALLVYIQVAKDKSEDTSKVDVVAAQLEVYKQQHGVYPDKLDDMVPALMPRIPKAGVIGLIYGKTENSYIFDVQKSLEYLFLCIRDEENKLPR